MTLVGLTGGIGAGKSTVANMMAELGAAVVDADAITRALQRAGTPVHSAIVAHFGDSVLLPDGELDRAKLAQIVFSDEAQKDALEKIVHPAVQAEVARQIADAGHGIVVLDIPLLSDEMAEAMALVVTVEASDDVRVERLVTRGMSQEDARSRIANQASTAERSSKADVVIDNAGSIVDLSRYVGMLWARIEALS